ncbi:HNH endonuclease [Paraclostridium sordellii]|uniref:HNH endonuclease n=1 Tax=Paraclostridium sordellii TaxID=1505 RepID=UPI0018982C9F|nr:HNH endonuclease [Paeniclostridium sordellii]
MCKCYICDEEINEKNETEEHIILNSLGGKLKSKKLICKNCNSKLGDSIDSVLSEKLKPIATLLNIKRDRGKPQKFTAYSTSKEKFNIYPGGIPESTKPTIEEIETNNGKLITIKARDKKEAKKILKGLNRKYKDIDVDKELSKSLETKQYMEDYLNFNIEIGSELEYRAICKMAINIYIFCGGEKNNIKHLLPYIKQEKNEDIFVKNFYKEEQVIEKSNEVLHTLIVKGSKKERILIVYIELFNAFKYIVLLNNEYTGKDIEYSYIYDVINNNQVYRNYNFNITRNEINEFFKQDYRCEELIIRDMENLLTYIYKKSFIDKFVNDIIQKILKANNETITKENIDKIIYNICKEMVPFINRGVSFTEQEIENILREALKGEDELK